MFRFTIRNVLWLTVVVALAVGWAADRWRLQSRYAMHINRLEYLLMETNGALNSANYRVEELRKRSAESQSMPATHNDP